MNKLETKYNDLAQCKLESSLVSTALLAIYNTVVSNSNDNKKINAILKT